MQSPCAVRTCSLPAVDENHLCSYHGAEFDLRDVAECDERDANLAICGCGDRCCLNTPFDEALSIWLGQQETRARLEVGVVESS